MSNAQDHVAVGLFEVSPEGVALVAGRCTGCESHYFPKPPNCRNPACTTGTVQEALIGRRGRLHSYTVQNYQPPALFRMDPWQPYAIGLVELPEGLRVLAMLTRVDPADLEIGSPLRLVAEPLYRNESGIDVLTYMYVPMTEIG